jgi:hypothetical protein
MRVSGLRRVARLLCVTVLSAGLPTAAVIAGAVLPKAEAAGAAMTCASSPGGAIALDGTSHCGLLETQGAENDWTFTVAAPGTQAWFDMPDPEGCTCRQWSLRDSKNHYAFTATTNRYVGHVFLAPEKYTLTVTTLSPLRPSNLYYTFKAWSEPAANSFNVTAPFTVTGSADPTQSTITQGAGTPQVNSGAGNLEQPGAVDLYNFTIPAGGARVVLQGTSGRNGARNIVLRDMTTPSRPRVLVDQRFGDVPAMPLAQGAYQLTIGSYTQATYPFDAPGPYSFKFLVLSTPVTYNATVPFTVTTDAINGVTRTGAGTVAQIGEQDIYKFDLAAQTRVTLHPCGAASVPMTYALYNPNGMVVTTTNSCNTDTVLDLPAGTGYQLVGMSSDLGLVDAAVGAYALSMTLGGATATTVRPFGTDPAAGAVVPSPLPAPGVALPMVGTIPAAGTVDVYSFAATAGQRITLKVNGNNTGLKMQLRGPGGLIVLLGGVQVGTVFSAYEAPYTLVDTGIYAFSVYAGSGTGAYNLSIYNPPAADQPTVQLPTATKYPVTIADGTQTNPASTTTPPATLPLAGAGNISKEGEQDLYRLNATKGQRLSFSYVNTANSLSLSWNILGPNGLEIAESRTATKVAAFFTTVVVPVTATGVYTVAMYATDSSKGTYSFQISLLPAAVPFEVTAAGVFLDPAHPVSVTKDAVGGATATGAGTIEVPGNVDEYTFSARAGQLMYLPDPGMTLYGVNGAAIPRIADPVSSDFLPAPRSGVYTMVISAGYLCCSNRTGDYSLTIGIAPSPEKFTVTVPFTATGGATRTTSTITDGGGTRTVAGAGFIEQAGSRDIYTFQGTGGDQLVIPNNAQINGTFNYTLLDPDGFVVDTEFCSGNCELFTLPRNGFYTLDVHRTSNGAYAISVARTAGTPPVVPQTQTFDALPGDSVTPNAPQVGAGLIEANADEQYLIDAVSGDAIDIQLMHSDPAQRASVVHGVPTTRGCGGGDNVNLSWNLRDPDGNVIFENKAVRFCSPTDVGAVVLGRTGTYTLTIGGATVLDTFDLTMPRVPRIGEVPQPGQAPPPPALTGADPATGTAGHFTTFSVYGTNLPTPTAAHVTSTANGTQLPATLREAHSVHGNVPALAASVQVDLTNAAVAVPGNYTVRLDLTGGGSVALAAPNYFVVHAASSAPPKLEITTLGLDRVRWGGMTRAYINVANTSDTDLAADVSIPIPAEVGSVKLVTPINRAALIADMRAAGATDAQIAAANVPDQVKTSPTTDANGNTTLNVNALAVVAGHSATLELEITAPAQPAGTSAFAISSALKVAAADEAPPTTTGCLTAQKIVKTIITTTTYLADGWEDAFGDLVKNWLEEHTDLPDYVDDMAADVAKLSVDGLDAVVLYAVVVEVVGVLALVFGIATAAYATLSSLAGAAAFIAAAAAFKEEWTKTIEVTELYVYWVVSNACDPNALIGPGTPTKVSIDPAPVFLDGGKILANTRANYEAEFENMGGLPAQLVEVDVPLSNQLDWNSFRLESVRVGSTDVPMTATGTWSARGQATVPVDGTTAVVTVTSQFRPDTGALTVLFAGPPPTDAHPLSPYGDFLPPNTNKPEGEGFVWYSAKVKNLPLGSYVTQTPATIKFDGHLTAPPAPLNTNSWRNMIGVDVPAGDHLVPGRVLKLTDNPLATSARVVQMTLVDPALTAMKDPRPNGLTIRVKSEAGDTTYLLDPRGWIASPSIGTARVYKYRDTHHLYGPIMTATLDVAHGKVKLKGRGANLGHSLVTMPTAVDIVIVDNGDRWCAKFGGTLSLSAGKKFLGKNAPAPSACAA